MAKKKSNKKKKKTNLLEQNKTSNLDPVVVSIQKGDFNLVQKLLENVSLDSSKDWSEGYYLLQTAIQHDQVQIASWLILKGCRINRVENDILSDTPLHLAICKNYCTVVKILLEKGADKSVKNTQGETPLHVSCKTENIVITKLLLEQNAAPDIPDVYSSTPLHISVEKECLEIVQLLLNHNAPVNAYTFKTDYEGFTPLHISVIKKNVEITKILLENKANINAPLSSINNKFHEFPFMMFKGYTPVHLAIESNEVKIVKLIFESQKGNIKTDLQGLTLLQLAIEIGNLEIIEILLNSGSNVNFYSNIDYCIGQTPLHMAIYKKDIRVVKSLLEKGANIDASIKLTQASDKSEQSFLNLSHAGYSSLHLAVQLGNTEIIKLLLSYYPEIDKADCKGFTPLHLSVELNKLEVVQILLEYEKLTKFIYNKDYCRGLTPLHLAVIKNNLKLVESLVTAGLNINQPIGIWIVNSPIDYPLVPYIKYKNYTALHVAVELKAYPMVELLVNNGANVNAATKDDCIMPLHISVRTKSKDIFYFLIERNANFLSKTNEEKNILHLAVENDWPELVTEFLPKGFDINDQTISGETLLFIAVDKGDEDIIEMLLKLNADVNVVNSNNESPLHIAAEFSEDIVKILLNYGANIDEVNLNYETPLCISVKNNNPEIVKELLKFNPNIHDISNKYAFSFAVQNCDNHIEIVDSLFHYGFELEAEDVKNSNILKVSILNGCIGLVECLLSHFFTTEENNLMVHDAVNEIDDNGKTPVDYAIENGNLDILNLLITHGARTPNIFSFFLLTAQTNNDSLCKVLLHCGADINACDEFGTTALHFATWYKNIEFVEFLLENNANVNITDDLLKQEFYRKCDVEKLGYFNNIHYTKEFQRRMFTSPLHIAITKKERNICDILIKFNANLNSKDGHGRAPLHLATAIKSYHQKQFLRKLLSYGADINAFDESKKLPIHYAFTPTCMCNIAFQNEYELYNECECNSVDDNDNYEIIDFFVKYIVFLSCMNNYVHKDNLKMISGYNYSQNLQSSCLLEIKRMKQEKIDNCTTYYDVLSEKSLSYARNKDIIAIFKTDESKNKFPLYYEILKENFKNLQSKDELMKYAIFSFNNLVPRKLPEDISEKILKLLNLLSLSSIIRAGNFSQQNHYTVTDYKVNNKKQKLKA